MLAEVPDLCQATGVSRPLRTEPHQYVRVAVEQLRNGSAARETQLVRLGGNPRVGAQDRAHL